MTEKARQITEGTLLPLSLVGTVMCFVWFIATMNMRITACAQTLAEHNEKFSHIESMEKDIAKIQVSQEMVIDQLDRMGKFMSENWKH